MNMKADKNEFEQFEKLIIIRIDDITASFTIKFADKADTKKALKLLEKQIKNLYDLFMSKGGDQGFKDDAMFSKIGYACASCEKGLTNLYG